jgi:hypothetical protein
MHFKLNNKNLIKTAFTGNQKVISERDFFTRVNLPYFNPNNPEDSNGEGWNNAIDDTRLNSYSSVGDNDKGGLAISLFGSNTFSSFWNVVGDKPINPVFECGTYHRSNGENSNDPSKAATLHQVYFKGQPPTDDEVRNRMIANINRLETNK